MKTNYEKLRELFMTVDENEKDLMELRFGCKLQIYGIGQEFKSVIIDTDWTDLGKRFNTRHPLYKFYEGQDCENRVNKGELKIIGNTLSEHHLRMYCEKKYKGLMNISIGQNGDIYQPHTNKLVVKLEPKPFDEQSEEVYGKIFNFLNEK